MVILVTPSLAQMLERREFLQSIITRICVPVESDQDIGITDHPKDHEIKTLCSVVDALPFRETATAQQHASEGLSILINSSSVFSEADPLTLSRDEDANYTLSFISPYWPFERHVSDYDQRERALPVRYLTLPVANTFFVNGSRATLFQDTWKIHFSNSASTNDGERGKTMWTKPFISYQGRQHLRRATIQADFDSNNLTRCVLPLTALTEPRVITKAMGNVVTEIQLPERKAPASTELESRVSKYLKDNPQATAAGPLLIYAAVRPPLSTDRVTNETPPQNYLQVSKFLNTFEDCTRLFRVTGGGGGWGKKQGLLSLDPAVDFDSHDTTLSTFPNIDDDVDDIGQLSDPKGMMPFGSTIQFWVWDNNNRSMKQTDAIYFPDLESKRGKESLTSGFDGPNDMHIVLGTGSRAEEREGVEGQGAVVSKKSKPGVSSQYLYGYFGMLSYGGAAMGSVEYAKKFGGCDPRWLCTGARSRIDVPNTTFVLDVENGPLLKTVHSD